MAATFIQSQAAANTNLNQAQTQLTTATRLNGELGAAVATRQVARAETLYGQVNTFLGLASTSNGKAYTEINDMARQANGPIENQSTRTASTVYQNIQDGINSVRTSSSALLNQLNDQRYNEANNTPKPPVDSSGQEVAEAQKAADENSRTQAPPAPIQTFDEFGNLVDVPVNYANDTNANTPELSSNQDVGNVDGAAVVGGNRDVVTTNQTQNGNESAPPDDITSRGPTINGSGIKEIGPVAVAPDFLKPIVAQPNILNKLSSMSYSISIYVMNAEEYKSMLTRTPQQKIIPTQQLLIQSGGIDQGLGFGIGQRNKFFDVDFYIDEVDIISTIGTQGGTRSSNGLILKFNIVEPNGVTLLGRLRNAVRAHYPSAVDTMTELNATFLMIIRFYGYDSNGTLVNGSQLGIKEIGSDNNAIVEKWFPFQFTNITYRIANKLVEYKCEATIPQVNVAYSWRATIPFDFQLTAPDVKSLLNGKTSLDALSGETPVLDQRGRRTAVSDPRIVAQDGITNKPPPKASSLSAKSVYSNGLAEALNNWQAQQVADGNQEYPDVYEINFEDAVGLIDAKVARPGKQDKTRTAQAPPTTAAEALNPKVSSYNKDSKNWSVTRGTPIAQLIELVLRNSTYITGQQTMFFDENTGQWTPKASAPTFQWFRIRCQVVPGKYDKKRRDFAYKIIYTVSRYQVNDPRIGAFPKAPYRGVHKIYNYWFTGQNTEVLDFHIDVDYNYVTPYTGKMNQVQQESGWDRYQAQNPRLYERRFFANKPNSEGTGGESDTTTPAAMVAERYYTFADIQKSNLTILGDPDLLQQSEVFYNNPKDISTGSWLADGSANFDASEVLFEIRFNPVTDYTITDGLAHVNANNLAYSQATGERNLPSESSVFAIAYVQSIFKQGKFIQKLIGYVRFFDPTLVIPGTTTVIGGSGSATLDKVSGNNPNTMAITNRTAVNDGTNTGPVVAPVYNDPMGTTDAENILNSVSNPRPKSGSNTVPDDAIDWGATPFIGS